MKTFFQFVLFSNLVLCQGWYNHPELEWKTIETQHFLIHYHVETRRSAEEAAAEEAPAEEEAPSEEEAPVEAAAEEAPSEEEASEEK